MARTKGLAAAWITGHFPPEWSYTRLPNVMLLDASLSSDAKVLWLYLFHLCHEQGTDGPEIGVAEARTAIGMSARVWNRARDELVAAGLLEVASRRGFARPNTYTVRVPWEAKNARMGDRKTHDPGDRKTHDPSFQDIEDSESLTTFDSHVASVQKVPKAERVDGRDLPFDALVEVCGISARSPRLKQVATALNGARGTQGIRTTFWLEVCDEAEARGEQPPAGGAMYERALAEAIRQRAALYRRGMGDAMLTPTALAKWWTDVPAEASKKKGQKVSGDEVANIVARTTQRRRTA